jgi:hypothetical protein
MRFVIAIFGRLIQGFSFAGADLQSVPKKYFEWHGLAIGQYTYHGLQIRTSF